MKPLIITLVILALFGAGVGGGLYYISQSGPQAGPQPGETTQVSDQSSQHGKSIDVPDDAPICPEHRVPEMICPFCKPSLVEELGWCGGHDVAEALCTRCNPTLIAAFKAENDWCTEHGLPESQCLICNPASDG